jgi:hypothetical protein
LNIFSGAMVVGFARRFQKLLKAGDRSIRTADCANLEQSPAGFETTCWQNALLAAGFPL